MSEKKTATAEKTEKKTVKKTSEKSAAKETATVKEFSGKYTKAIGRRKTAVAQVRLYSEKAEGVAFVNDKSFKDYFGVDLAASALQPLEVTGHAQDFDVSVVVKGGGPIGQVAAVRHGIARAVLALEPESRAVLKTNGFLTRDPRTKERKKPGLKGARKRAQWSKR